MLIPSANDAATALALHVGNGSTARFVSLMNAKARELGLVDTTFVNPHGLDERGHVSSARDATVLVRYALGVPSIREALARTSYSLAGRQQFPTTDDLLASWPPLVGGKTGHTEDAGWSEAAAASRRRRDRLRNRSRRRHARRAERRAAHLARVRARPLPAGGGRSTRAVSTEKPTPSTGRHASSSLRRGRFCVP